MLVFCTGTIAGIVVLVIIVVILVIIIVIVTAYIKIRKKVRLKFIHYPDIYGLEQKVIMIDSHLCISKSMLVCT